MSRHSPTLLAAALIASCNGNCDDNAAAVVEQLRSLGPFVSTIEVYSDTNGDGTVGPDDVTERGFVIDPRPSVRRILRIEFLMPVPREPLKYVDCDEDPCPNFISFVSFIEPPDDEPWVHRTYFDDNPLDETTTGLSTKVVTYELHSDLTSPLLATNAIPVTVDVALNLLADTAEPFKFAFVLARQIGLHSERTPPRIVDVEPSPTVPLPGWGRPITGADFGPGEGLAEVLARADANFIGVPLEERLSPHQVISLEFDDPMSNMVASVDPFPASPGPSDPAGIDLQASTIGFLTPFTTASSDTTVGMAPDRVYRIQILADNDLDQTPFLRGSQNDQGQYIIPYFDEQLYQSLRANGYSDSDLSGAPVFSFRTGPFRIVAPEHHGNTNIQRSVTGALQFAVPAEGIASPTTIRVVVEPAGQTAQDTLVAFPIGVADSIVQDGLPARTSDVTRHAIPVLRQEI